MEIQNIIDSFFEEKQPEYRIDIDELEQSLDYFSHKDHLPLSIYDNPESKKDIMMNYIRQTYKIYDDMLCEFLAGEKLGTNEYTTTLPIKELQKRIDKVKI